LYDPATNSFADFRNNPFIPNSIISNQNTTVYQGHDGVIWLGTPGYGLSYFNPDNNLFKTIYPFLNSDYSIIDTWCRAAGQDKEGNIWLATAKGVAEYDQEWNLLQTWANDNDQTSILYNNSIRSILVDDRGDVWIGTAKGLNRYHPSTGSWIFLQTSMVFRSPFFG
jgi:ligand-binding sensor domain-containing protein